MSVTASTIVTAPRHATDWARGRGRDQIFFSSMAVAIALTIFAGFARTYYLKTYTGAAPLSPLVHLHGLVFTTWVLLFVGQTALVATGRTRIHRRLGVAGAGLAVVMIVVGILTAIAAAKRGLTIGPLDPLASMVVPFVEIMAFLILVSAGLYFRRSTEFHKRLMLLVMVSLLGPATGRIPYVAGHVLAPIALQFLFLAACPLYDRFTRGRVHPAYIWGGLLIVIELPLKFIGLTDIWRGFASWVIG